MREQANDRQSHKKLWHKNQNQSASYIYYHYRLPSSFSIYEQVRIRWLQSSPRRLLPGQMEILFKILRCEHVISPISRQD